MIADSPARQETNLRAVGLLMQDSSDPLTYQTGVLLEVVALSDARGEGVPEPVLANAHDTAYAWLLRERSR